MDQSSGWSDHGEDRAQAPSKIGAVPPSPGLKRSVTARFSTQGAQASLQGASNHTYGGLRQRQARNGMVLGSSGHIQAEALPWTPAAFLLGLLRRLLRLHEVENGLLTVYTSRATGDVGSQSAQVGVAAVDMVKRNSRWSSRTALSLTFTESVRGVGLPLGTVCTSRQRKFGEHSEPTLGRLDPAFGHGPCWTSRATASSPCSSEGRSA